jgi:hypothetical protein
MIIGTAISSGVCSRKREAWPRVRRSRGRRHRRYATRYRLWQSAWGAHQVATVMVAMNLKYQPDFLIDDLSDVETIIDTLEW